MKIEWMKWEMNMAGRSDDKRVEEEKGTGTALV
jgi:hypothetical protein